VRDAHSFRACAYQLRTASTSNASRHSAALTMFRKQTHVAYAGIDVAQASMRTIRVLVGTYSANGHNSSAGCTPKFLIVY
jgi:hypothetical protein